jgi:hypothetical protein
LGSPLFSSKVFCFEPLAFWDCLFYHRRSFILNPLYFGVASFFIRGLLFWAPCVLDLPLFSLEVFCFGPLAFWMCLFFHWRPFCFEHLAFWGCIFFHRRSFVLSLRTKVAIMHLHSRLWLTWRNSLFVEYGASIASNFDKGDQCFGETKVILLLWGYMGSASLKTSHPQGLPL